MRAAVWNQTASIHLQPAIGEFCQLVIVRDDHERSPRLAVHLFEQAEHLVRGVTIEVSGGFVREYAARRPNQRAGQCDTLALAARELPGEVIHAR